MWIAALFAAQVAASIVLLRRLSRGRSPPVLPGAAGHDLQPTTVLVPTRNEARRIGPLLERLPRMGLPVAEILVVDTASVDGTQALVEAAARQDPRIRLLSDPPREKGWVGKAWALEHARREARGHWLLCLDADVVPGPGLEATVVAEAERRGLDLVSFAPRFAGQTAPERWLQPALLTTLVYRSGGPGTANPERVLANGQCFLVRRSVLEAHGGYQAARSSYSEDVTLARYLAQRGARVAFLDGSRLFDVCSYASAREMWREWGRSIGLADATPRARQIGDLALIALVQGSPLVLLGLWLFAVLPPGLPSTALAALNGALLVIRVAMMGALAQNYERRGLPYWLSIFADPLAVVRIVLSTVRRPTRWR